MERTCVTEVGEGEGRRGRKNSIAGVGQLKLIKVMRGTASVGSW